MRHLNLEHAREALAALERSAPAAPGRLTLEAGTDAVIRIDAPRARGALTVSMMRELADAVLALAGTPTRSVLLRSAHPGMFCSGGHLGQVRASLLEVGAGQTMSRCMTVVLDSLWQGPWQVAAFVDGPALGGGSELLTACDAVFVGSQATIGFVHGRLGVVPGWGGAARLVAAVGRRNALALLGTAAVLDAEAALRAGLAQGSLVDGEAWLDAIRRVPVEAVHAGKRQIQAAASFVRDDDRESEIFGTVWGGPVHRERLSS